MTSSTDVNKFLFPFNFYNTDDSLTLSYRGQERKSFSEIDLSVPKMQEERISELVQILDKYD